ncbi:MAG: formylglycine-generating enzyme family protein [Luteolibacter sp.]
MKSLVLGIAAFTSAAWFTSAQTPPTPEVGLYAGITVTGTEGSLYMIESTNDLTQTDGWSEIQWLPLKPGSNLWIDTSSTVAGKKFYRVVEAAAQPVANMVPIDPGTFVMGSPDTEVGHLPLESPQTQVTLTKGFFIGKHEVTQAEYLAVKGNNPSFFTGDTSRPVELVTWDNAVSYCAMLTTSEQTAGRCPADWSYRLPTEAEWEYACRAGTATRFSYGDDPSYTVGLNYAWYTENSDGTTHPVGQKAPNPWGLYDMHGNVWEWCMDSSDGSANYPGGSVNDPFVTTGPRRVIRGGVWDRSAVDPEFSSRSAFRINGLPEESHKTVGFRVVLAPNQ